MVWYPTDSSDQNNHLQTIFVKYTIMEGPLVWWLVAAVQPLSPLTHNDPLTSWKRHLVWTSSIGNGSPEAHCKGTETNFAQTWVKLLITGELGHTWTALCISFFYPLQSPQQSSQVCLLAAKGCSKLCIANYCTHNKLLADGFTPFEKTKSSWRWSSQAGKI